MSKVLKGGRVVTKEGQWQAVGRKETRATRLSGW